MRGDASSPRTANTRCSEPATPSAAAQKVCATMPSSQCETRAIAHRKEGLQPAKCSDVFNLFPMTVACVCRSPSPVRVPRLVQGRSAGRLCRVLHSTHCTP